MKRYIFAILISFVFFAVEAQRVAVKNNFAYDILRTPNLSLELSLGRKWTLDTQLGANFFLYSTAPNGSHYKAKKWSHWMVQPEFRYWICDVFNGWFVGLHAHVGLMNISGINIPYFVLQNKQNQMSQFRYESLFYGAGVSVGYQWILSNRFSIESSLGLGYTRFQYDRYRCGGCGTRDVRGEADFLGPTKVAVSLVYMLK